MKTFEFNPHGFRGIDLSFNCKKCGGRCSYEEMRYSSENPFMNEDEGLICKNCHAFYHARIWVTMLGKGKGVIENLEQSDEIEITKLPFIGGYDGYEDVDFSVSKTWFKENYESSINNIERLNEIKIEHPKVHNIFSLRNVFNNQLFSSIITSLEAYLSDSFVYVLYHNKAYLNNFLSTDFRYKKLKVEDIPTKVEILRDLKKRSFQNPKDIKRLYKKTFKINFPDVVHLTLLVHKRHDIIHRNGKTSEGKIIITNPLEIEEVIKTVNQFVGEVDKIITDL